MELVGYGYRTFFVEKLEGGCEILDDVAGLLLGKLDPVLDVVEQLAPIDLLEDQVEPLGLLEVLHQMDDVLVTLAVVERLDLLEHPGPGVPRDLLDDLNGILGVRPDILARLHGSVGPLAQHLSRELVQLLEGGGHQRGVGLLLLAAAGLGLLFALLPQLGGILLGQGLTGLST